MSSRIIFVFALILFIAASYILGVHIRDYARTTLVFTPAENTNLTIGQSFRDNIWLPATQNMPRPLCQSPISETNCPDWNLTKAQTQFFLTTAPLIAIKLHPLKGEPIIAVGGVGDAGSGHETAGAIDKAAQGTPYSFLVMDTDFTLPSGEDRSGTLLRTFIPISAAGRISEVLEITYDVTPAWQKTLYLQWVSIGALVGLLSLLFLLLRWYSSRSESIIEIQHEQHADLEAAKTKAEEESVEKSKFLANVSHELRTPLNSIIGFSEILKDEVMGPLGSAQYKEYATDIHASGTHLLSLINDILDFSKADANKLDIEYQETDVTKLLKNCLRLIAQRAEAANVKLSSDFADEHVVTMTDPKRLKQIILNLLTNAVKFTPPNGRITLMCKQDLLNKKISIAVVDTGVGIAEKDISKVMAAFGQVKNEYSSKSEGTGLGLPLTRKLVELMDGQFVISSKLGEGTTVTLTFPYTGSA